MAKIIAVNKLVSWKSGGTRISGKVRQVLGDHVIVRASDGVDYIVMKSALSLESAPERAGG